MGRYSLMMMGSDVVLYGDIEDNLFYQLYVLIEPFLFYIFWLIFGAITLYYAYRDWDDDEDGKIVLAGLWVYYIVYCMIVWTVKLSYYSAMIFIAIITGGLLILGSGG